MIEMCIRNQVYLGTPISKCLHRYVQALVSNSYESYSSVDGLYMTIYPAEYRGGKIVVKCVTFELSLLNQEQVGTFWANGRTVFIQFQGDEWSNGHSFLINFLAVQKPDACELFTWPIKICCV